jgi:hypothetical protein
VSFQVMVVIGRVMVSVVAMEKMLVEAAVF